MNWKELVKDYFHFTSKDRIAAFLVALILALVLLYPHFSINNDLAKSGILTDSAWIKAARKLIPDSSAIIYSPNNNHGRGQIVESRETPLFDFDPNTLSIEGWSRLGIRDKTIRTIHNYLKKGGRFKLSKDLLRIYGFPENDYLRLAPFIKIQNSDFQKVLPNQQLSELKLDRGRSHINKIPSLEINSADSSAFIALPGIGPVLAKRIINFRNKLGGFYSVRQLSETFGLADSVYKKILPYLTLNNTSVKKIRLNSCTLQELKDHPYIRYQIGNAILNYKTQHGAFTTIEEIKNIMLITDEIFVKIYPYLDL